MPTISEIYSRYPIPQGLRQHQLRVTAVASVICDGFNLSLDRDDVIRACLVHDMGNLIKFDLDQLPELLEPEGANYWRERKAELIAKYGPDEHAATVAIVRELGVSKKIISYIDLIGFKNTIKAVESTDFEGKICHYADHRSTPHGVESLAERLADGDRRYSHRTDRPTIAPDHYQALRDASFELEYQIFAHLNFPPEHLTEQLVAPDMTKLVDFQF